MASPRGRKGRPGDGGTQAVAVVVLGDLGRSPRMQYHALSLVEQARRHVHVIAYGGSTPHLSVVQNKAIDIHYLPNSPQTVSEWFPRVVALAFKALFQLIVLFHALLVIPKTTHILVQNPPSIPTLIVCKIVSAMRGSKLVIDWHNFGYTILSLSLGVKHPFVRWSESYEKWCGPLGDVHFCVTEAMKKELKQNWSIEGAKVLYDHPPQFFQPLSHEQLHDFFVKIHDELAAPMHKRDCCALPFREAATSKASSRTVTSTMFTESSQSQQAKQIQSIQSRPALVVSSTSWTPDEDFSILLDAAERYDRETRDLQKYPRILFVITGKGPQRSMFEKRMKKMVLKKVAFRLAWLSSEDYPRLICAADLGVSLHVSSSGFDLPMKVVDMFGCGVPACSANYSCVTELVQHNKNGMLFKDSKELAAQLKELFHGFPDNCPKLKQLKRGALASSKRRWTDEWARVGLPVFRERNGSKKKE